MSERRAWSISDAEAMEAVAPLDLDAAIKAVIDAMPFNPRMRSRAEKWQLAVLWSHARRVARLTPLVNAKRHEDVLAWMTRLNDPSSTFRPARCAS